MASKNIVAEYNWIDANLNLRSKTKIFPFIQTTETKLTPININTSLKISTFPEWNFDGSSTGQSQTNSSDLILRPISYILNPFIEASDMIFGHYYYIVLCEVVDSPSNNYQKLLSICNATSEHVSWFGIEQEYIFLNKDGKLLGEELINTNQLDYASNQHYCSVGTGKAIGRQIANLHMKRCLQAGIRICGINSEVTPSQWEFQIGPSNSMDVCNDLWFARYLLIRIAEEFDVCVSFHPKPFSHLNGSGAHTNFSTLKMRSENGITYIHKAIEKLSKKHKEHIAVYGEHNNLRLTGKNETANIETFSYGNCDRGSSIRIPVNVVKDGKGYLEDRRPAANCDPYLVVAAILKTVLLDD